MGPGGQGGASSISTTAWHPSGNISSAIGHLAQRLDRRLLHHHEPLQLRLAGLVRRVHLLPQGETVAAMARHQGQQRLRVRMRRLPTVIEMRVP